MRVLLQFIFIKILMLSNTMIFSPVSTESARGKSSPVCHALQIGFIYYYILNPIQGGLFEPPFWVCVCVFLCVCDGGDGSGGKTATLPYLFLDNSQMHETLHRLSSIQLGSNYANTFPLTIMD